MTKIDFKRSLCATALTVGAVLLTACGEGGATNNGSSSDVLNIGIPYPETGGYAAFGADFSDGARLAIKQSNDEGVEVAGAKVTVTGHFCDTEADTAKAAACGRRLSAQDDVVAVTVATSIETLPLLAFNESRTDPFLIVSSTTSEQFVGGGNNLVARFWLTTSGYMPDFAAALKAALVKEGTITPPSIGVMYTNDEFGNGWNSNFVDAWKAEGGTVAGSAAYASDSTDLYPQLTSLLKSKPDYIAAPGTCEQSALVAKQSRELGYKGHFLIQASCGPAALAKSAPGVDLTDSVFEGTPWDVGSPEIDKFRTDFKAEYGRDATLTAGNGFEQIMLVINAAKEAQSTNDPSVLRAAIPTVLTADQPWNFIGASDLDKTGEVKTTVHPRMYKSADVIIDFVD